MPGRQCTRSLACENKKHTSVVTTGSPDNAGIPCAMVLTVSFGLSLVIGLSCHHHRRNAQSIPGRLGIGVEMPGPHDFAVRFDAARLAPPSVHRILRPTSRDGRETSPL
jgi:hypothetical protein